jgi:hypothetical protein
MLLNDFKVAALSGLRIVPLVKFVIPLSVSSLPAPVCFN